MKLTQRTRRAAAATMMAVAIAGGGIAVGAVTAAGPGEAAQAPAATAPSGQTPRSSYADVVRRVLPSVVLIRTANGLGSGLVLDGNGRAAMASFPVADHTQPARPGRQR
jgi:putative serine protease PepD